MSIKTLTIKDGIVADPSILGIPLETRMISQSPKERNDRSADALDWPIGLTFHDTSASDDARICAETLAQKGVIDEIHRGAHFFVDRTRIVQVMLLDTVSGHAGDGGEGDHATIGIVLCEPVADRTCEQHAMVLAAALMETYALDTLFTHAMWQKVDCPRWLCAQQGDWKAFADGVRAVRASGLVPEIYTALRWAEAQGIWRCAPDDLQAPLLRSEALCLLYRALTHAERS